MEDIFDKLNGVLGITKYSNSEVITPKWVVTDMVDLFAKEDKTIFSPDRKFLDPAVKSGRFLVELYQRLMVSELMVQAFPDKQDRKIHILEHQLYGVATSPVAATIVRKQLYGNPQIAGNIVYTADKVTKELIQGAFGIMKFDVVIGNPPYNKGMDLDFVDIGFELSKQYTVMITPAKWQTADANQKITSKMSYGEFRKQLVPHMSHVVFYPDSADVFGARLDAGITYFLMNKETHDKCLIQNRCKLQAKLESTEIRDIKSGQSLFNIGNELNNLLNSFPRFNKFNTGNGKYAVGSRLMFSGGGGKVSHSVISDGGGNGGNTFSLSGNLLVTTPARVTETIETDADSYILWQSDNIDECHSFKSWLDTKMVRFLLFIGLGSRNMTTIYDFRFVPAPPSGKFDHIYTDAELYEAFNLPQKYIDVIEAVIKERK